jgi:hypothetical protein
MISSHSGFQGNCIDVTEFNGTIIIVETDNEAQSVHTSPTNFQAFIDGVKAGEFDHFGTDYVVK